MTSPGARLYRGLDDRLGEANALNQLGSCSTDRAIPGGRRQPERALELYRELGNRLGEANALNNLGVVQQATGDYPPAAASHEQALELYRDLGNLLGEANALTTWASCSRRPGTILRPPPAYRALELYRDLGDRHGEAEALR